MYVIQRKGSNFAYELQMRKIIFFTAVSTFLLVGIISVKAQKNSDSKVKKILYFNPEVEPDIEEIKEPTNHAFFSAVSDNFSGRRNKMLRAEVQIPFDSIEKQTITDYCVNNDADFAIVKAWKGDTMGNLVYRATARNFNPVMAMAGKITVAEVEELVEPGELDPDHIHTPGVFVKRIVDVGSSLKRIEQRTTRKRAAA